MTIETHERALRIAERYGLSIYGALMVSAALLANCKTLHSEDMQDGQVIERQLTIRNPFASP
jgi:predicted nucleic acid-binding protein